jgi:Ser/Thr protein kinase RdoA (MazF antagonist)
MKPFRELSRRGRLVRLRKLANQSLKSYGIVGAQLNFIQYGENIIYRVDCPGRVDMRSVADCFVPNRYVLRIHASSDAEMIASELTWLAALSTEGGLPVPAPVPNNDGELVTKIKTEEIPAGRMISLMQWLDGRRLRKGFKPNHLAALGQTVARMHAFSAKWQPPKGFFRPTWDWESNLGGSMFKHPMEEIVGMIPEKFLQPFQVVSMKAQQAMDNFGKSFDAYGLIHADLYPENVLFRDGKALPIDFEDCGYGYWMWDIAVALCEWAWGREWEQMRDAFQDGYARVRTLTDAQWAQLDLFIATQFATIVLWSTALLMNDPKRAGEYAPWREKVGNQLLGYFNR